MRITGGQARGIPLTSPPGGDVRPATDRMREAVFSSLGSRVDDASFIDWFAGTGAYGLEAISRGARSGAFVEHNGRVAAVLRANLAAVCQSLGLAAPPATVSVTDVFSWQPAAPADLIFADPPYALAGARASAIFTHAATALAADGRLIFELPGELAIEPPGWTLLRRLGGKGRGQPAVAIYAKA
jgi:16S rRNA (guanine966-N2)-methyltransferase